MPDPEIGTAWSAFWATMTGVMGGLGVYLRMRRREDEASGESTVGAAPRPQVVCAGLHGDQAERIRETHELVSAMSRMLIEEGEDGQVRSRYRLMHQEVMSSLAESIRIQTQILDRITDRRARERREESNT